MKKLKSIGTSKIIQTVAAIVTVATVATVGILSVPPTPAMNVDGVACSTFAQCRALADAGSVWAFIGDWRSSGKLSVPNNNITLVGDEGAVISFASVSGNSVEMSDFEVQGSPAGVNGIFWTGENGSIHNNLVHDTGLTGIRLYTSSNTLVMDNKSYDNRRGVAGNSDGINCDGGSNNSFIGNEMSNNGDDGLDTWKCTGSIVKYSNAHHNCGGGDMNGFKLGPGGGGLIEFNTASYNCSAGFASNEGANVYRFNSADHNKIGFSDWCGAGCVKIREYYGNIAWANGIDFKMSIPAQWIKFDASNTTATPASDSPTNTNTATVPTLTDTPTQTATRIPPTFTAVPTATPILVICDSLPCTIIIEGR